MSDRKMQRSLHAMCPWCKSQNLIVTDGKIICARCSYASDVTDEPQIAVIGWTFANDADFLSCECKSAEIYDAIVRSVKENGFDFDWNDHQCKKIPCTPIINNGYKIECSPKTWGSIMATAHGIDDPEGILYSGMAFDFPKEPIYPKKSVDFNLIVPFEI